MTPSRLLLFSTTMLAACAAGAAEAAEPLFTFKGMRVGDVLTVNYSSMGCFHDIAYEFTFRRGERITVEIIAVRGHRPWTDERRNPAPPEKLGDSFLTDNDIARLDRMLEFYRTKPELGCTTVDSLSLQLRTTRRATTTENLEDGTCSKAGNQATFSLLGLIGAMRMRIELPNVKID